MEVLALGLALETLRATDVDRDGVHELVGSGRDGDKAVLVVVDEEITSVDLGVGPTRPQPARIVVDLDGDERPELLVWSAGELVAFRPDGQELGRVPLAARGRVESTSSAGGEALGLTLQSPAVAVEDADGDGLRDILVVDGDELVVHRTGDTIGVATERWPLPERLEDPVFQDREAYRFVTDVHLWDVDGDGRVDLVLQRVLSDGSLLATQTEIQVHLGTGVGFGEAMVLTIEGGAADVSPADLDGDGDQELVSLRLDLDPAALAHSLLDQRVPVAVVAWSWDDGYGPMTTVKSLRAPVSEGGASWNLFGDVDGDGLADLAVHREGELTVWAGPDHDRVLHRETVGVRVDELLLLADLTGDGTAEVVGWSRGSADIVVLGR
ncbi:MAG: VCBS repeat-containing protein [Proteobacteria bacterium]|nr:VCBS repeat-containing protein [Pseudomonadota bacterium]